MPALLACPYSLPISLQLIRAVFSDFTMAISRMSCAASFLLLTLAAPVTSFSASVPVSDRRSAATTTRTALHMAQSSSITSSGFFDLPEDGMDLLRDSSSSSPDLLRRHEVEDVPRFAERDELHRLRQEVLGMRQSLNDARSVGDTQRVKKLTRAILAAQQRDAEFMYQVALERMEAASRAGMSAEAETYRMEAKRARAALPQFQLEGLWVGRYGDNFQMVNVTYTGDLLTAHKVTGDNHVPKSEVTFQVDLSPSSKEHLDPIELGGDAIAQWGSKYLQRYAGQGQVAANGFVNRKWLDGQLILVNQYFSFAWLPTGHQVFFGRPSPELTLKLLRESGSHRQMFPSHNAIGEVLEPNPRQYLERCLEETELLDDEMEVGDSIFRSHDQDYYYQQEGCFE